MSDLATLTTAVNAMTKEQAKAWLRAVLGPPHRVLEGQEYEDISLLLKLANPVYSSNNQHTMTDEYRLGGKLYNVTHFTKFDKKPAISEVEEEV